jgi:hypothetical protein
LSAAASFAAAARFDSHGVGDALDGVAHADLFFEQKARKTYSMQLAFRLLLSLLH